MRAILLLSLSTLVGVGDLRAQELTLRRALKEARPDGGVHAAVLKRQLRALAREHGRSGRFLCRGSSMRRDEPGPLAATPEKEYNDSEAYAHEVGVLGTVAQVVTGSLGAREVDSFGVSLGADGVLQVAAQVQGTPPEVQVTSADGDEVLGMAWSKAPPLNLEVPAGRYFVRLYQPTGSCSYSLSLGMKSQALAALAPGTASVSVGPGLKALKLTLTEDGRVSIRLASSPSADTSLWLLNGRWRYVFDVDDAGSIGREAGLNALLPKGEYFVYLRADVSTTTKVTTTLQASKIPVLGTTALNGVIGGGEEDLDLYQVTVGAAELTTLAIRGNTGTPIGDSYLMVLDSNMGLALESDDEGGSLSSLSSISGVLPAGSYYVASTGYYDIGGYTISKATAKGTTVAAKAGTNQGTITALDSAVTFSLSLKTPSRVEFEVREDTLADAEIFVLDQKTGLSVGWEDDSFDASRCSFGTRLPAGEYYVIVKDWGGGKGSFDVRIVPPLARWGEAWTVMARGHEGNPLYLVIGRKQVPATNPLVGLVSGNLLIDLSGASVFPLALPKGGFLDFRAGMKPQSGLFVQTVEFASPSRGEYSNLLD